MKDLSFYKKNLERLKSMSPDCAECIRDRLRCHHHDYIRDYIEELEALSPFDEVKFDHFWAAYPRKVSKAMSRAIWEKMRVSDELFQKIMKALENHKRTAQWTEHGNRYIPHPPTWLNQERWEDEVELPGNKGNEKYNNI